MEEDSSVGYHPCVSVTSIIHGNAALPMHKGTHHIIQVN